MTDYSFKPTDRLLLAKTVIDKVHLLDVDYSLRNR